MKQSHFRVFTERRGYVIVVFFLLGCFLVGKLFDLQIVNYDRYQELVVDQVTVETKENAERGEIYDSNMSVLATNVTAWRVFISPRDIDRAERKSSLTRGFLRFSSKSVNETEDTMKQSERIADGLSAILGIDRDSILAKCAKKNRLDETLKTSVNETVKNEVVAFVERYHLENQVHLQALSERYYPYGNLASSVIGFTGSEGTGIYGLELYYDSELTGTAGRYITAKDSYGNDMPYDYETYFPSESGLSVVTTIDATVQEALERQLAASYNDCAPNAKVAGIVMEVKTGAILGMATYPDFDLNDPYTLNPFYENKLASSGYEEDSDEYKELKKNCRLEMWANKCVSELYEPGSTFKPITSAMAFELGVLKETDNFYCAGSYTVEGTTTVIHCHRTWGHRDVTFRQGLQYSCNPVLMQVAARVGSANFYDYFGAFGYLARTGIDLPGEATSIFHTQSGLGPVELAVSSFGQRFKTTMIQQITALSSIANGGQLITPHLISALIDQNGKTVYTYEPEIKRQVISKDTAVLINDILEESVFVVGGNTNCYVKGYRICGKTGTSEKFDILDADGNSYLRLGSTIAYAPANDPEIAVLFVCDEPTCENTYGSNVAAPYCAQFMAEILPYLGFEPNYTEEELATLEISVGNYVGLDLASAKQKAQSAGLTYEVVGNGHLVTAQIPSSGVQVTKGSARVILYTGDEIVKNTISVPDVKGKSAAAASQQLVNAGLSVHVIGATNTGTAGAVVVSQSIASGTEVPRGTVVQITMRHLDNTD